MIDAALFFDIPAPTGTSALIAAGVFLTLVGVAFIAFRVLRKTVRMAIRMVLVLLILTVAVIGSCALWYSGIGSTPRQRVLPPARTR